MRLSMTMIAKNESENIARCFDSWWDHVDEVVFVDDGSTDDTMDVVKKYTEEHDAQWVEVPFSENPTRQDWGAKVVISRFREPSEAMTTDFAALRNYADALATGDWRTWCDLDDVVEGLNRLRKAVEEADPAIYQFYCRYEYAFDPEGNCFCELWRERMVRADNPGTGWGGRVHECQLIPPPMTFVERDLAVWKHYSDHVQVAERNEKLLWEWVDAEPDNARALSYLAFELMAKRVEREEDGQKISGADLEALKASIPLFQRYLEMPGEPPESRAQATRRLSQVFMMLNQPDAAYQISIPMLAEVPHWPDTMLTMAEVAHEQQNWSRVIEFANKVLQQGRPETTLIINPTDYDMRPMVLLADAFAQMEKFEEAVKLGEEVAARNPQFMAVGLQLQLWRMQLGRNQAAATWANCAQMLVGHDEPEKALAMLNTAPFFVYDHPAVVSARIAVNSILEEPYKVEIMGESPRGNFLVRSLRRQMENPIQEDRSKAEEQEAA